MRFGSLPGVLLALGALSACQSSTADRSEAAPFCKRYCDRFRECSSQTDDRSCMSSCYDYQATTVDSTEFLEVGVPCLVASSCDDVVSGDYYWKCYAEAAAQVQPSEELIARCEEIALREFECGYWTDVGQCVVGYKTLKQQVIEPVLDCARQENCESVATCYEGLFQ